MSGNPCHLFCRKLVLSEKDMLHQTVLEITTSSNNNPSKTTTKTNNKKENLAQNFSRKTAEEHESDL